MDELVSGGTATGAEAAGTGAATDAAWLAAYALGLAVSRDDDHGCIEDLADACSGRVELVARARADLRRLDRGDHASYRRALRLLDGTRDRLVQSTTRRRGLTAVS